MGRPKNSPEEFAKHLDKSGGENACWIWTGAKNKAGYGATSYNWKHFTAHRLAWVFANGEIPEGLCVCHKCDNPPCCNPSHLFLGTSPENTRDMVKKGRQSRGKKHSDALMPNRPRGSGHYAAKLTEEIVVQMRHLYDSGELSTRQISTKFSVPYSTTQKVVLRSKWKHLP